jgi:hypothetical protein
MSVIIINALTMPAYLAPVQLRIIARDKAITAELWLRSKHGTWRFFLVMPDSLVEIDREEKPVVSGQTIG